MTYRLKLVDGEWRKDEPRLKFPEGTVITCPGCRAPLFRVKRDIRQGDTRSSKDFEGEMEFQRNGTCPGCGTKFHQGIGLEQLHTREGWIG